MPSKAFFLGTLLCAFNSYAQTELPADLILKNGKVYTDHTTGHSWSQALSIRNGNILSIGSDKALEKERGPTTKVIDLKGKVVLPGFNDAHVHLVSGGLALSRLDLSGITGINQLQERLKSYAEANRQKTWIFGQGWDHTQFKGQKYPTKQDLDTIVSDRPVMLWHTDRHQIALNSKGLEYLKITSQTPNPPAGEILKDDKGEPTGILLEAAAFEYANKADNPSGEELRQAVRLAQEEFIRSGVTSVQGGPIRGEDEVRALEELYSSKQLRFRYAMWGKLEQPKEFLALKEKYKHLPEEWIRFEAVKGYLDGVISSRTAAMQNAYTDAPNEKGETTYTQEKLNVLVLNANRLGLPVALHAIGDRAVAMAVNAFASARHTLFNSRIRNRIEHLEVVPEFIYPKFTEKDIVASFQPSHMTYDIESQNYNDARLGPQRVKHAFAWKTFWNARAHIAFGTDWPVMPLNPMIGLFSAVTRQHFDGKPTRGWQPQQRLTMLEAIEAYTLGSAYATREDHVKGTLREGKHADITILTQDPFKVRSKDLLKIQPYMTIVDGQIVYDGSIAMLSPAKPKNTSPQN